MDQASQCWVLVRTRTVLGPGQPETIKQPTLKLPRTAPLISPTLTVTDLIQRLLICLQHLTDQSSPYNKSPSLISLHKPYSDQNLRGFRSHSLKQSIRESSEQGTHRWSLSSIAYDYDYSSYCFVSSVSFDFAIIFSFYLVHLFLYSLSNIWLIISLGGCVWLWYKYEILIPGFYRRCNVAEPSVFGESNFYKIFPWFIERWMKKK